MACGTPVVATSVGGIPELVEDGVTGLLVPPDRPDELARAINELLENPGLMARMGGLAREKAVECFDLRRISGSLTFYDSVLRRLAPTDALRRRMEAGISAPAAGSFHSAVSP
jgi:starch synthase